MLFLGDFCALKNTCFVFLNSNSFKLFAADLPIDKIKKCMGNPEDDAENEVLKAEQEIQVKHIFPYCWFNVQVIPI